MRRVTPVTDTDLLAQIIQRDVQALGALYDRHAAVLYRLALRITADRRLTETVVQMVFQTVWHSAARFPNTGSVRHWLIALTRQRALAMVQRGDSEPDLEMTGSEAAHAPDNENDENDSGAEAELGAVQRALQALPLRQRDTIERAYYGGQTCAAIAAELGQPISTVMADLRHGLLALHAHLRADAQNTDDHKVPSLMITPRKP